MRIERAAIAGVFGWVQSVRDRVALGGIAEATRVSGGSKHIVVSEEGPTQELAVCDGAALAHPVIRVSLIIQHRRITRSQSGTGRVAMLAVALTLKS
jgi:hypothetical protein